MELKTAARRRHVAELKARVLSECERPGASVAAIALVHGLNTNLAHKWRRAARRLASQSPATGWASLILLKIRLHKSYNLPSLAIQYKIISCPPPKKTFLWSLFATDAFLYSLFRLRLI